MWKLLSPLVASFVGGEIKFVASQAKRVAVVGAIIALFAVIALVFLCVAAFLALAELYGGPIAALILAGGAIVIIAILALVLKSQAAAARRKREAQALADRKALTAAATLAAVPSAIRHPLLALALPVIGVALAGLTSKKSRRRRKRTERD